MAGLTSRRHYSNTGSEAHLSIGINAAATTFALAPGGGTGMPTTPFTAALDYQTATEEVILVTGLAGDTVTACTRGYDGTAAQSHAGNAVLVHVLVSKDADEANDHTSSTAAHGTASALVGATDVQTLPGKTLSSWRGLATATDPGLKTQAIGSGTAQQITCLNTAGSVTVFSVAQDGKVAGGPAAFTGLATGDKLLVVKAFSAGHTGSLFEAQDSAAAPRFLLDAKGKIVHKPSDNATAAVYYVPPNASSATYLLLRDATDTSDNFVLQTSGEITNAAKLWMRGWFSDDPIRYPLDGSLFKVDAAGAVTAKNTGGRVSSTRVTTGSQSTTGGAEVMWAAMHTAASLTAGRRYKITVRCGVDSGASTGHIYNVRVRNSKSASNPTTASTEVSLYRDATINTAVMTAAWSDEYVADTSGTNTFGLSIARVTGANELVISGNTVPALLLIEDMGT